MRRSAVLRDGATSRAAACRTRRRAGTTADGLVPRRRCRRAACRSGTRSTTRSARCTGSTRRRWPTQLRRPVGAVDVLGYWREALLDVARRRNGAPAARACSSGSSPTSRRGRGRPPAVCMGDARLVNALIGGVGGPGARRLRGRLRRQSGRRRRLQPLPRPRRSASTTTCRAGRAVRGGDVGALERGDRSRARRPSTTGRRSAPTSSCMTATRAMVQWGLADPIVEEVKTRGPRLGVASSTGRRDERTPTAPRPTSTSGCTASIPTCGRGTSRGSSRGSTSTAGPRGSSGSGSCRTRAGPCSGATSTVDGEWLGIDESRLRYDDFDLTDGSRTTGGACGSGGDPARRAATVPLRRCRPARVSGPDAGPHVPLSVTSRRRRPADRFGTGTGDDVGETSLPRSRFEQSLAVAGTVTVGGDRRDRCAAGGHRDRSWGPRNWRVGVHPRRPPVRATAQLYFVGAPQLATRRAATSATRPGSAHLVCVDGDDRLRRRRRARSLPTRLRFADEDGAPLDVELDPDLAERQLRHGPHVRGARALARTGGPSSRRACRDGRSRSAAGSTPAATAAPEGS